MGAQSEGIWQQREGEDGAVMGMTAGFCFCFIR